MKITMKTQTHHQEMPMLAGIAGIIRWVEELANLLSGPLLTLGLGIALIDLLTDGSLLARLPLLLYAWAISQAVRVDAQLVATWDRARAALREGRIWALVGLIALGGVLAYVAWVAAQVFALHESEGVTTGMALARLGMDGAGWLVQRTALSVFLVCLAGWTRYHPPTKDVVVEAEGERARLEADLMLEPLRALVRAQQVRGAHGVWDALRGKDTTSDIGAAQMEKMAHIGGASRWDEQLPRPVTDRGNPKTTTGAGAVRQEGQEGQEGQEDMERGAGVIQLPRRRGVSIARTKGANRPRPTGVRTAIVEAKARAAWQSGMSVGQLQRAAGISRSAAGKYRRTFLAEDQLRPADEAIR